MHTWCSRRTRTGAEHTRTGVAEGCELCVCVGIEPRSAEVSLLPHIFFTAYVNKKNIKAAVLKYLGETSHSQKSVKTI